MRADGCDKRGCSWGSRLCLSSMRRKIKLLKKFDLFSEKLIFLWGRKQKTSRPSFSSLHYNYIIYNWYLILVIFRLLAAPLDKFRDHHGKFQIKIRTHRFGQVGLYIYWLHGPTQCFKYYNTCINFRLIWFNLVFKEHWGIFAVTNNVAEGEILCSPWTPSIFSKDFEPLISYGLVCARLKHVEEIERLRKNWPL